MQPDDRVNEVETANSEIKEVDLNLNEVCKSICKIIYKNKFGTGFFIKLYMEEKELLCLMTNEHVIEKDMIESKEIIDVKYNCEKKWIKIKLDEKKRFIKYNKEMDFTIVEMIADDKIKDKYFLLPNINNIDYINKDIYIVQFPEGKKLSYSNGKIKDVNNFEIIYDASTKSGSSGSPILIKNTTEVIGIHKQGSNKKKENYGTLINSIIQILNNNKKDNNLDKNLIEEEVKVAKQNGFILIGEVGIGKSTLIEVLFNREVIKVIKIVKDYDRLKIRQNKIYYLKLKNGKCISLIDTDGLGCPEKDEEIIKNDLQIIWKEKIKIKGILFLLNFYQVRFKDFVLVKWHNIFPSKNFWKHLIIIFTRYWDKNGKLENHKQKLIKSCITMFSEIMKEFKNVSDVIDFKELKIKYYDLNPFVKDDEDRKIQKKKDKEDLEILLDDFCKKEPLFC